MSGRKSGFLAAMLVTMLLLGGCGADGKVDENQARNWYTEMTRGDGGTNSVVNDRNADGYGNYTGGPNWGGENTDRNTYGMRTDDNDLGGSTLGQDIRNAWDTVKNDVKNMGNDNNGGR